MVLPQAMAWVQYWFRILSLKFCRKSKKNCGDISPQSPAFCMYVSSMESMRDDYEWTAMIIPMKMAMRMDWISLDVEPTWPSIQRVQAHLHPSPAVWPNAKQNDDGLVFQFGRNLRAYFCLANSILTCSTSSILLHQANTNSSSCFG